MEDFAQFATPLEEKPPVTPDFSGSAIPLDPVPAQANIHLILATDSKPDAVAKSIDLSKQTGVPQPAVEQDPEAYAQMAQLKTNRDITAQNPKLQAWLAANPLNAKIASDDMHNLAGIEQTLSTWNPSAGEKASEWIKNLFGLNEREKSRAMNTFAEQRSGITPSEARTAVGGMSEIPEQATNKFVNAFSFGLVPDLAGAAQTGIGGVAGGAGYLAGLLTGPFSAVNAAFTPLKAELGLSKVAGESWISGTAKTMADQAITLGAASALAEFGDALNSPSLGEAAGKEGEALKSGAATGAVFGLAGKILPDNTIVQSVLRWAGISAALDVAAGKKPFQDISNWDQLTPAQKGEAVFNYGLNAFFSLKGAGRTTGGWITDAAKAEQANMDFEKLNTLSQFVTDSKTLDRNSVEFKNLVSTMGEDGSLQDVYVDAKTLTNVLNQTGTPVDELARLMPEVVKSYQEAIATNGDVRIPVQDYATHIVKTDLNDALLPHLKASPDGLTFTEGQTFLKDQQKTMQDQAAKIIEQRQADTAFQTSSKAVQKTLQQQMIDAGRSPDEARTSSVLPSKFIDRISAAMGITPEEFYAEHGTKTVGEDLAGGFNQGDALYTPALRAAYKENSVSSAMLRRNYPQLTPMRAQSLIDQMVKDGYITPKSHVEGTFDVTDKLKSMSKEDLLYQSAQDQPQLSALHNLTPENLIHADELGGLAVPSIAVVKKGMGLENYGEITLIGNKELVNPEKTSVFNADAYTSTFPRAEYGKVKSAVAEKLIAEFKPFSDKFEERLNDTIWDNSVNKSDPYEIISRLLRSDAAKAKYLSEHGLDVKPAMIENKPRWEFVSMPAWKNFVKKANWKAENLGWDDPARQQLYKDAGKAAKEAQDQALAKYPSDEKTLVEHLRKLFREEMLSDDGTTLKYSYLNIAKDDVSKIGTKRVGIVKTGERLNKLMKGKEADYANWVENKVMPMFGEPHISLRGKKVEYNLENIVDHMTHRGVQATEKTMTFGEGKARAVAATKITSFQEMRNRAEWQIEPKADVTKAREDAKKSMEDWRNNVVDYYGDKSSREFGRVWEGLDASMRAVAKWAKGRGFAEALRSEGFRGVPDHLIEEGKAAGNLFMKAPVPYFEAKPERAVKLSEFSGAVIPKDSSPEVKAILEKHDIPYRVYGKQFDEEARTKAVEKFRNELAKQGEETLFQKNLASYHPDTRTISLLRNANLTSYIHETGHYFLDTYAKIAAKPDAPELVKQDMGKVLDWFGIKDTPEMSALDKWHSMTLDEQRPLHEKLAQGFEQYIMEGKAPSVELMPYFARMKQWMLQVYQNLNALGEPITDEVRGVFDRMLASEEDIRQAEQARGYQDLFKTPEEAQKFNVSGETFDKIQAMGKDATQTAVDELSAKSVKDMRFISRAKSKAMRDLQKEASGLRSEARIDARREVLQTPVYRAWQFLTRKSVDTSKPIEYVDQSLFEAIARLGGIDRQAILSEWGVSHEDVKGKFGKPVLRKEGGRSLDDIATLLGDEGYLPKDEHGKVDLRDFEDAFAAELSGDKQYALDADYGKLYGIEQKPDISGLDAGKLNTDMLRGLKGDVVSEADIAKIEKLGMAKKGEIDPDIVSDLFGFESAEDLVHTLGGAEHPLKAIETRTDQIMMERHGELASPGAIELAAEAAIHNDVRARVMATMLNAFTKGKGSARLMAEAAKQVAEKVISEKKISELRPLQFLAAEARAGKELEKAMKKGDLAGMIEHQRAQLLNNRLAKAAQDAIASVRKGVEYQAKFDKDSIRKKIDLEDREQIDDLRDRFDFRQKPPLGPDKQQVQYTQWAESQKAVGYSPMEHPDMVNPSVRMPYKQMTIGQFKGLIDTMKSIEYIGRERQSVTIDGKRMVLNELIQQELIPKMVARGEKFTDAQLAEAPRRGVDPFFRVALDRVGALLRALGTELKPQHFKANKYDLHEIMGPFHRYLFEPVFKGNYDFVDMTKQVSDEFRKGAESLGKDWQKSLLEVVTNHNLTDNSLSTPAKRRLTRGDLIGIALHVGNESNFDKLSKGMGWVPQEIWRALENNMTAKDWEATKLLGKMAGAHWDDMVAMNRRLGNDSPEKIQPRPFMTKFGQMPGWYAPVRYDRIRSRLGTKQAEARAVNPAEGLFSRDYYRADTTTNGSLNARTGYHDFIDLNWHATEAAIHDTLRDLAYREKLIDAHKIYANKDFRSQFLRTYGHEEYSALGKWLGNLVNADVGEEKQSKLTSILATTRRAMVANGIAFRISTMEKHGGSAGMKSIGYFAGGGNKYLLARAKATAVNHKAEVVEGLAKSHELRARYLQQDRDFRQTVSSLAEPESIHGKAERFGHAGVAWLDFLTAVPTFHAAYDWAVTDGIPVRLGGTGKPMSEQDAIKWADSVVREAHGTNIESGRSNLIQNRSELIKMLTILHGFMNNSLGQNMDSVDKMLHANGFGKPELLARYMMTQIAPAILAGYIAFGPKVDDQPWWEWVAKSIAGEFAAEVPMLREAFSVVVEGHDSAGLPPWIRAIGDIGKVGKDIAKGGEVKHPFKDTGNAAGLFLPGLGQAGATTQFLYDVKTGEQYPETVGDWVRGVTYGKSEPPK